MSGLESTPAFKERALQIGMEQTFLDALLAAGVNTYGKLAFVCSSRPSSGNDDALFTALKDLTGTVPQSQVMIVRRLWYEAHSHALCDLEARASRTADSSPRELPLAERLERLKRQRRDLTGIELDVRTEPGHGLVDRVQAMLDSSQVLHIPPEKCISRQDEINGKQADLCARRKHQGYQASVQLEMRDFRGAQTPAMLPASRLGIRPNRPI